MKKFIIITFCFIPFLSIAQKNRTSEPIIRSPLFTVITDTIKKKMKEDNIPSFSVAVAQNGTVIWQESFGMADKENNIKATPATVYPIGSLSKSITATALMMLASRKKLSLHDPVDKYLIDTPIKYYEGGEGKITLHYLMNMMAGIPHQFQYFYPDETKKSPDIKIEMRNSGISVFPPGEVFLYSNFSPGLTEMVIKNVTHTSFPDFMKKEFFSPLGMYNSSVNRKHILTRLQARGYNSKGDLLPVSEFYPKAGGGYYSSIADLILYGMLHLRNKSVFSQGLLSDSAIQELHKPVFNKFYSNGWGVFNVSDSNFTLISDGSIAGAASFLLLLPSRNIAVACLANSTGASDITTNIALTIAGLLVKEFGEEFGRFYQLNESQFNDLSFSPNDSLYGNWKGIINTHKDVIPVSMNFDRSGKVFIQLQKQPESVLSNMRIDNGLIKGKCQGTILLPETEGKPHYLELTLKQSGKRLFGSISTQSYLSSRNYFLLPFYISLNKD